MNWLNKPVLPKQAQQHASLTARVCYWFIVSAINIGVRFYCTA